MDDDNQLAYKEALSLANSLHAQHYSHVKNWKPLDDLRGLISQIDNMTCGLVKDKPANRFYGEQHINPRYYGVVKFDGFSRGASGTYYAEIEVLDLLAADELREAAHLFNQLAEALERE